MTDLFLSIGLCTYNRADLLENTLNSLKEQTLDPNKFEIIVVNNNSSDNTNEVIEQFAKENEHLKVIALEEKNQGISYARNKCIAEAKGDFMVFIDDDELASPNWAENYYKIIDKNPDATMIAGKIEILYPPDEIPSWNSEYIENWHGRYNFGDEPFQITQELIDNHKAYYPNNGNMAVKRTFLNEIKGFDTNLGRKGYSLAGGEDTKLGKIALEMGKILIYNPNSLIKHLILPERNSLQFLQQKHFEQGKSFIDVKHSDRTLFKSFKIFIHKVLSIFVRSAQMVFTNKIQTIYLNLKNCFDMGIISKILRG